jgi:hypothetical protein
VEGDEGPYDPNQLPVTVTRGWVWAIFGLLFQRLFLKTELGKVDLLNHTLACQGRVWLPPSVVSFQ